MTSPMYVLSPDPTMAAAGGLPQGVAQGAWAQGRERSTRGPSGEIPQLSPHRVPQPRVHALLVLLLVVMPRCVSHVEHSVGFHGYSTMIRAWYPVLCCAYPPRTIHDQV